MPQTRAQALRSSVKNQRPAGREPGELYVNFPDRQIGFLDASRVHRDLVAVRFFSATTDYAAGDFVIQGGQLWKAPAAIPAGPFNAASWGGAPLGFVSIKDTPPLNPYHGQMWWESDTSNLYIFYQDIDSSAWVQVVGPEMTAASSAAAIAAAEAAAGAAAEAAEDAQAAADAAAASAAAADDAVEGIGFDELYEKHGDGVRLRYTQTILAGFDRLGVTGPGNPPFVPRTVTLSQSGSTVTAGSNVFTAEHIGKIIEWASGAEAIITYVASELVATCTVDRAQTVASGAATVNNKSFTECIFGNSISHPIVRTLIRKRWREFGFGGYVWSSGTTDTTGLGIAAIAFTGGAADVTTGVDYNTLPWSACTQLPTGGSAAFFFVSAYALGGERELGHGLKPEAMLTDTAQVTWRRAAGAMTVERRRAWDIAWTTIDTIADANAGSTAFVTRKYKHTLGAGWEYRFTATSGTIKIVMFAMSNRTTPGYVPWTLYTSGNDINNFMLLPTADWANIVIPVGIDLMTFHMAMARPGDDDPGDWLPSLSAFRAMWKTASSPRDIDTFWITAWEGVSGQVEQKAYGDALRQMALSNDDGYASFYSLFGDYTTESYRRGWIKDGIHPSFVGSAVAGQHIDRVMGIAEHPVAKHGRAVNAPVVDADLLRIRGTDVAATLTRMRADRHAGCRWLSGAMSLIGSGALAAPVGASDFTIAIDLDVLADVSAGIMPLTLINSNPFDTTAPGGLQMYQEAASLRIQLRDTPNTNSSLYIWNYFGTVNAGRRGWLVVRSDRANNRFDFTFEGRAMQGLEPAATVVSGSGAPIATWAGVGSDFTIAQGSATARSTNIYGVMFWRSRLTDAEIMANVFNSVPAPVPDFWWGLDEGLGRTTIDLSGNGKSGRFQLGVPGSYNLQSAPIWRVPNSQQGLARAWIASLDHTATLIAGDDVIATHTGGRDWTLPALPALGDTVRMTKASAAAIRFGCPALTQIKTGAGTTVGTDATTVGTAGRLNMNTNYGSATLRCVRSEPGVAFEWSLIASVGALVWT